MYCILDKAVTLIRRLLANRYRILIHCQAGQQRSVAIVLAFIIKYTGMNLTTAQELLRTKWEDANGSNFFKALGQYETDIKVGELS
jgi:protein-tyrosine phosphatase